MSLTRIINEPKRGIGKTSMDAVELAAITKETSMYEIIKNAADYNMNSVYLYCRDFVASIDELRENKDNMKISDLV